MGNILTFDELPQAVAILTKEIGELKKLLLENQLHLNPTQEEQPLDIHETAKFLNLSVPTIYSKVSKRELPALKQGKKLHFLKSELFEYLKRGRKKTNEEIAEEASAYTKKKGGKNG